MEQFIWNWLLVLISLLGLPAIFAWGLTTVNRHTKANLVNRYGINSQVYLGCLGIVIHELSHLIMAVIFRHGIQSVRLLKLPHLNQTNGADDDLVLGYVNHTWSQASFYQSIGNLFIGVAPIFGCTASLLGLDAWLYPGLAQAIFKIADHPFDPDWAGSWLALTTNTSSWWQLLLLLFLTILIVIGGFDLSPADYQNSSLGLVTMLILLTVATAIFSIFDQHAGQILSVITSFGFTVGLILSYSLIVSLIIMFITKLLPLRR
ncbi:hypothetical protein RA086_10320 [Lactiplantibacillus sp. WILCCON 0030]|uniref:Integral membrane protein n=1 Tax=Lactiplantibacillus brownii TaxID=3069269 RepID=A0ABU1AAJ6_9LACO|nr:hypothetical protein [Lactiplantibacillus brownii]MDQ7938003.1 hypothetical protein [Lactiplantibacillus brownii]